jgi:hypothetical protein
LNEVSSYLQEIAAALDYIHARGIVHRDIKSSNVLLDGENHCYLADFGIARTSEETGLTQTGNLLGTVDYMAPELFEADGKADAQSDLYSLGILLFEMVTGTVPFTGESQLAVASMHMSKQPPTPRAFVPALSSQVEYVMLRALEKQPDLRYDNASELAKAFRLAVDGRLQEASAAVMERKLSRPLVLPAVSDYDDYTYAPGSQENRMARQDLQSQVYPQQSALPSSRPSSSGSRGRIVTVIALVALLAVLGPMVYVLLTDQPHQANTLPLPGVTGTTKGVATPNLTATAQAVANNATATAQAQVSATAGVLQTATAGNTAYQSALTAADNEQWDQGLAHSNCAFQQDGYHVTTIPLLLNGVVGCRENSTQYTNMTVSVDMTILSGKSGGLFFNINPGLLGANAGYFFEVDTQGNYQISRSQDLTTSPNSDVILGPTHSDALQTGTGVKNTLQVIARNDGTMLFYINGTFVTQQHDTTYTSGYIGFAAVAAQATQKAEDVYTNVAVHQN